MKYHVSKNGNNRNPGTGAEPFGTVQFGVSKLAEGDELVVHRGVYVERVQVRALGRKREPTPTIISAADGDVVVIDGSGNETEKRNEQLFRSLGNDEWEQVGDTDEFVSSEPLLAGAVARGSFLDRRPYTRLITYDSLDDLRSNNQKFGPMPEAGEPGDPDGPLVDGRYPSAPKRPWVYLGPGIFRADGGTIHVRLSPTTHTHPRVRNYLGETDPRQLSLAITTDETPALLVKNCGGIVIRGLTLRGGGGYGVSIEQSKFTRLDHLTILAGSDGVHIHDDSGETWISDCVIDGGLPPWLFRSDLKDEYTIAGTQPAKMNLLAKRTTDTLLRCAPNTSNFLVSNCEFVNGHDLQLAGTNIEFRNSWVDNVNDDVFYVGEVANDVRIHHNVVERVLTCINMTQHLSAEGTVYFYRNLVDLRRPTIGRRPHPRPDVIDQLTAQHQGDEGDDTDEFDNLNLSLLRYGQFFKRKPPDPALSIFHNTIAVVEQTRAASYPHFLRYDGQSRRRVMNNIFIAINPSAESDRPIAFLPRPTDPAISDGNCYHRIGEQEAPLVAHQAYDAPIPGGNARDQRTYDTLGQMKSSQYFDDSRQFYPPGTEDSGLESDPGFRSMQPWPLDPVLPQADDFRLADSSPLHGNGVDLMTDLASLDGPPPATAPDIGCYRDDAPLEVGVDGRHRFPPAPPAADRVSE